MGVRDRAREGVGPADFRSRTPFARADVRCAELWQSAGVDLPRQDVDPGGLLEYSVVFTDRSLNHMSRAVRGRDDRHHRHPAADLRCRDGGDRPGWRHLRHGGRCAAAGDGAALPGRAQRALLLPLVPDPRRGSLADQTTVCSARPASDEAQAPWSPAPVEEVVEAIERTRPGVVFAAHVETAAGMVLPDDYVRAIAAATHGVGGLLVLDCIASGALWVDMAELGVDVLLSAPQKGWSGSPCAGYVMLGEAGRARVMSTTSTSFAVDLQKWLTITEAYTQGSDAVPRHDADRHARAQRGPHARDARRRAPRAARGPALARHAGARPARRARLPLRRGRGVRRPQRGGGLHRRPRDPQRREVQAARPPGGRRRAPDVRRRPTTSPPSGSGSSASTSSPTSTAPSGGSRRTSGTDLVSYSVTASDPRAAAAAGGQRPRCQPVVTGRDGSVTHSLHDPGYKAARTPATSIASTSWQAVTPLPQYAATSASGVAPTVA